MGISLTMGLLGLKAAPENNMIFNMAALGLFEFALGSLVVYIGGLWAVDLLPTKAAGSVKGIIGIFSYIGAATQDWISGLLIQNSKTTINGIESYNFDSVFSFWIVSSIIAILIPLLLWKEKSSE
jgi:OPA family sugar phosphate sensor protein UhpC-like MFS transporter